MSRSPLGQEERCSAETWFTRGHRYEARHDLSACKSLEDIFGGIGEYNYKGGISHLLEKTRNKTYVRDVCTRCGNILERAQAASERSP